MSEENITAPSAPYNFLNPSLDYLGTKTRIRFSRSCLKHGKITYDHGKIVNICIVYDINKYNNTSSDPTLENCSFHAVSLTKIPISIGTNILDKELDLTDVDLTHTLVVGLEEM